ncbi:MAG: sulfatase-like hydrolase/transferase [Candidatus Eisenbacteria bacterium]|uniref:Sulfatase-like hydrolase/transferase n=1 Tax=Eiseniibacteriota bacterium TaxID=2212470 RepID=A0A948W8Y6_UNCEI|nr:sulfatase-like hydrolase/transferase [Candidatus Eisenbacteria bacterium]MBU1950331.1 sulfatase-like hydrolase/transferase [Candidatus Eisenbacteria bacterium]MBU2693191.1 sulfatase-like hydrolase/transferase [Candidatus Eisenbacteria bacterium]
MLITRQSRFSSLLIIAAAIILSMALPSCSKAPQKPAPSVILISIDTCRPDHLSCYGYPHNTTPRIDAFARDGIRFKNTVSAVPMTLPSHCSMMTGIYPLVHGVHDNLSYRLHDSATTLAEILREHGYDTAGIIGSFVLDSRFGIQQGFTLYNDRLNSSLAADKSSGSERKAQEVTRLAEAYLQKSHNRPFFLFLHYYDPHDSYLPPEPYASAHPGRPYDGEIAYTDHCIGEVLDKLKELEIYDSSLIIITADHGEGLREHEELVHGYYIYQSTLRVPLMIKPPHASNPRELDGPASLIDIPPTILGQLGLEIPEIMQGIDLLAEGGAVSKGETTRYLLCESLIPTKFGCSPLLGVITEDWKYIQAPRAELYNLKTDSAELDNRLSAEPRHARRLSARLKNLLAEQPTGGSADSRAMPDAETRERLQSLGYISGGEIDESFTFDNSRPDPKDLLVVYQGLQNVMHLMGAGAFTEADSLCRALMKDHPDILNLHIILGDIATQKGDAAAAMEHYRRFIELSPGPDPARPDTIDPEQAQAHLGLANHLADAGELEEAIAEYREALRYIPHHVDALFNLAASLGEAGRLDEVIVTLKRLLTIKPDYAEAHYNLGYAYLLQQKFEEAADQFSEALRLQPDYADAYIELGNIQISRGRIPDAVFNYSEALRSEPGRPDVLIKYANGLLKMGRTDEALMKYREGVSRFPNFPPLANELALILASHQDPRYRDGEEAVRIATSLCERTGFSDALFMGTLAAAYAETGRFDAAVKMEEQAQRAAQSAGITALVQSSEARLALYQQRQPLRIRFGP